MTKRIFTKEHRLKISKALKGRKQASTGMLGKKHSNKARNKMRLAKKGHKVSLKTKKKISLALKGRMLSQQTKKKIARAQIGNKNNLGRKLSEKTKKKIGDAHRGSKCYFWKGGTTRISLSIRTCKKYINWRKDVFERDNYTCQICGKRGHRLNAHHIITLSCLLKKYRITNVKKAYKCKQLFDINNGRTLCEECHKKTPTFAKNLIYQKA